MLSTYQFVDVDPGFIKSVEEFVPSVMSKDRLVTKQIDSIDVTGEKMFEYVKVRRSIQSK